MQEKFSICDFWDINPEYEAVMDEVMENAKTQNDIFNEEDDETMSIFGTNLRNKAGFVLKRKFYPNNGLGHEKNAMELISEFKWDKKWNGSMTAEDFIVCKQGAIKIGSGSDYQVIVLGKEFYNEADAVNIKKRYQLYGYKHYII